MDALPKAVPKSVGEKYAKALASVDGVKFVINEKRAAKDLVSDDEKDLSSAD